MRDPKSAAAGQFAGLEPAAPGTARDSRGGSEAEGSGLVNGDSGWSRKGVWPPRPDAVSFHVVMKALVAAGMWEEAHEVLVEMRDER